VKEIAMNYTIQKNDIDLLRKADLSAEDIAHSMHVAE
jgi:hypothetical protein